MVIEPNYPVLNCLICSCEKTKDVAKHMLHSLEKFSTRNDYSIFIGCDSNDELDESLFNYIQTPQKNWKTETLYQLERIKILNPNLKYILLLLDDFIFKSVIDITLLENLFKSVKEKEIKYLMLKPTSDNFLNHFVNSIKAVPLTKSTNFYKVRKNHPYYFSLQAAIWDIDYLIENVKKCDDIWAFENMKLTNVNHYALTEPALNYQHIVEKGEWDFNAKEICLNSIGYFEPGNRKFRTKNFYILFLLYIRNISFFIFGYSIMQLKNKLKHSTN